MMGYDVGAVGKKTEPTGDLREAEGDREKLD